MPLAVSALQFGAQARSGPGDGVECGVAGVEVATTLVGETTLEAPLDPVWASGRPADHSGVVRQLADHPHLRLQAIEWSVLHQAAVDAIGGACGTAADIGRVDVEDVQARSPAIRSNFLG